MTEGQNSSIAGAYGDQLLVVDFAVETESIPAHKLNQNCGPELIPSDVSAPPPLLLDVDTDSNVSLEPTGICKPLPGIHSRQPHGLKPLPHLLTC